jgi:solute carrier family 39 (zinc transporter), member 9
LTALTFLRIITSAIVRTATDTADGHSLLSFPAAIPDEQHTSKRYTTTNWGARQTHPFRLRSRPSDKNEASRSCVSCRPASHLLGYRSVDFQSRGIVLQAYPTSIRIHPRRLSAAKASLHHGRASPSSGALRTSTICPSLYLLSVLSLTSLSTGRHGICVSPSTCASSTFPAVLNANLNRSFLAGALPLSMTLTQSQLRLISSIGVGILVGTSLIVIIPEGVEAIANPMLNPPGSPAASQIHNTRHLSFLDSRSVSVAVTVAARSIDADNALGGILFPRAKASSREDEEAAEAADGTAPAKSGGGGGGDETSTDPTKHHQGFGKSKQKQEDGAAAAAPAPTDEPRSLPTFFIGFALVTGFVLMFLIDRLPRHAVDKLQSGPTTRHISLDNLASSSLAGDSDEGVEEEGFLGSLTPTPRQSRGLATTVGLVIHAAADGIAMGASATTEDMKLGLVIFVAIMVHKAPAAFGLTSVLLKHGLSKRAARGHLVVFSLAAPFGALGTYILIKLLGGGNMEGERGQWWTGMLLLFSAGTFLWVVPSSSLPLPLPYTLMLTKQVRRYASDAGGSRRARPPLARQRLLGRGHPGGTT